MTSTPLTPESVQNALTKLSQWFPDQTATINKYQNEIIHNILNDTAPDPNSPLAAINSQKANPAVSAASAYTLKNVDLSRFADTEFFEISDLSQPHILATGKALLSIGAFVLGVAGLYTTYNTNTTRELLRQIGPEPLNGFYSMFQNFNSAQTAYAKAKAIFSIAGSLWAVSGFSVLIQAWRDQASWFDWVKTGVVVIAQLIVWFASDGLAFIAKVALTIVSATNMTQDIVSAISAWQSYLNQSGSANEAISVATFIPGGSFKFTTSDIGVTLSADCKTLTGQSHNSVLDITNNSLDAQIDNINGTLQLNACTAAQPSATFTPLGTYQQTSENIIVTLKATCLNLQGSPVVSTLDITNLSTAGTISNINGILTADKS